MIFTKLQKKYSSITTEGIRFAGSKNKIIPFILEVLEESAPHAEKILDGFSGTTRVSQAFKKIGKQVICNDCADISKIFGQCYLLNRKAPDYYQEIIDYLNRLPGEVGWFTENYGGLPNSGNSTQEDGKKRLWQIHNSMKLDSIRKKIDDLTSDEIEKSVLLTSLILAMDSVDSSLGHQVSYLRSWSKRSYKDAILKVPFLILDNREHMVYQKDIFEVADKKVDLVYYDPPYGTNNEETKTTRVRYNSYYHVWKSIVLYDKPKTFGEANRREDSKDKYNKSPFESCDKKVVKDSIYELIKITKAPKIIFSYSNRGRVPIKELLSLLSQWKIKSFEIPYKTNVMTDLKKHGLSANTNYLEENKEYLFFINKA